MTFLEGFLICMSFLGTGFIVVTLFSSIVIAGKALIEYAAIHKARKNLRDRKLPRMGS